MSKLPNGANPKYLYKAYKYIPNYDRTGGSNRLVEHTPEPGEKFEVQCTWCHDEAGHRCVEHHVGYVVNLKVYDKSVQS